MSTLSSSELSNLENVRRWAEQFEGKEAKILRKAAKEIIRVYKTMDHRGETEEALAKIEELIRSDLKDVRMIGGFVLEDGILKLRWEPTIAEWIYTLATDREWDVREGAQLALKSALEHHFEEAIIFVERWIDDPDPNVRRTALMGCRPKPRQPEEQARRKLDVVEKILGDTDPYVKRNVPYALGFWGHYPDILLSRMYEWAKSPNETLRRNLALTLDDSLADHDLTMTVRLLEILALDSHRPVRTAVQRALRRLQKKHPAFFETTIKQWLQNEDLKPVVAEILA